MAFVQPTVNPLTTLFTPPASCFNGAWTSEVQPTGAPILFQGNNTNCWPQGGLGEAAFSPGLCPVGFTTANASVVASKTYGVCCPSGFSVTGQNSLCASTATAAVNIDCIYAAGATAVCNPGTAPSGAIFFQNDIVVVYQQTDLSMFPLGYTPSQVAVSSATNNATVQSTSPAAVHHGLPTAAIAGLAVGIVVFLLIVVGAILFMCCIRKKRTGGAHLRRSVHDDDGKQHMESEVELIEEHHYGKRG